MEIYSKEMDQLQRLLLMSLKVWLHVLGGARKAKGCIHFICIHFVQLTLLGTGNSGDSVLQHSKYFKQDQLNRRKMN